MKPGVLNVGDMLHATKMVIMSQIPTLTFPRGQAHFSLSDLDIPVRVAY